MSLPQRNDQKSPATTSAEIVIVEDDASVARLLRRWLEQNGWSVSVAGTIDEARPILAGTEWDVALLDRRLPDGDGVSLCNEIRAEPANEGRYILMLTGESSEAAKLEGFSCGADDYVTKPFNHHELVARIRAGLRIVGLQKALRASNDRLERLSNTDALTGAHNKRWLMSELKRLFDHAHRYARPLSIALIDVDLFKNFNDVWGHQVGDSVLRHVAQCISGRIRRTDMLARYGGEEFVIIMPETPLLEAVHVAENVRATVAQRSLQLDGQQHGVTISLGVAGFPHTPFSSPETLLAAADRALYRAKNNGRNRVDLERRREASRLSEASISPSA